MNTINFKVFKEFVRSGTFGGILLLACVIISLAVAQTGWYEPFEKFLSSHFGFTNNFIHLRYPVLEWINDGLMAIFFLMVGLEIKRELVEGELSSPKQALLPVFAALGGAIVPALIYWLLNKNSSSANGWGIPMATDIAFALAILSLLGKRVPATLKIFLAALAIVDDLIAILVIAIFYSAELHITYLIYSGAIVLVLYIFNWCGIKNLAFYLLPGVLLWYFIHHSGIHATIAGVLTAITVPTTKDAIESPLEKLEHALTRPVNFMIMPLFALANTIIPIETNMVYGLASNLGSGIFLGLFLGKPIGITATCWLMVKLKLADLPRYAGFKHIVGIGLLGGIGFTMSIFIALLSFSDPALQIEAKFAVLVTSTAAAISGCWLLSSKTKKPVDELNKNERPFGAAAP